MKLLNLKSIIWDFIHTRVLWSVKISRIYVLLSGDVDVQVPQLFGYAVSHKDQSSVH